MKVFRKIPGYLNIWSLLSLIIVILILLPNLTILINFFTEKAENWAHIQEFILPDLLKNTGLIMLFTGLFTILVGTSLAWLVSAYDFPMKKFFKWALILPLAIPPFIAGYTYNGILDYTGVIQTTLRNNWDISINQSYVNILNLPGAVFIFTMFLFPYVYTITRAFLAHQSASLVENARLLGRNSWEIYFKVVLPISRGAIVGGVSLVLLEVLNDYGLVQYFGVPTFSTAIFQTWFGMNDLNSAIKLAATLMFIVFAILILEKVMRGRKKYSSTTAKTRPLTPIKLNGSKAWLAFGYCLMIFMLAFLIPFIQMVDWMILTFEKIASPEFTSFITNSVLVSFIGAALVMVFAVIIANFARMHQSFVSKSAARITILGYSIPGAVIAVGISTIFIDLDKWLFAFYEAVGMEASLFLSTSLFILISAYIIRFLAIGYNSVEAGFDKIGNKYTEASRMLGENLTKTFFKVDLRMIKVPLISGFILVFIDILKELPLTLILRPFNFDTLATKAYQYASDEQIHEASLASILIVVISGIAIYIFHQVLEKEPN
ncbi:ABC transporter permease [Jeotgalibacillus haloalkalitolerans]|uniref:Iron ABC transporter permease n=1 Tax=Jeotgalibacillus haloalkalitolerans TaxID=3104292 RepID=A0ABU5KJ91_9BACL|nr:iron ABC transporter permease [Jeotgalibacillus sp. HH7-29]MDZ5711163.1 iron ABC transporter permease [Jeotgalibacillus sp. HH7-29]